MTRLLKPVRRATRHEYRVLYSQQRPIVVSLEPGDVIVFRELGRRAVWSLPVDLAFKYAVRCQVAAEQRERRKNGKLLKGGRP